MPASPMRWRGHAGAPGRAPGGSKRKGNIAVPPIEFDTERLAFRVWEERHREPFAAMNADAEVMRHFPAPLTAEQSNASVDHGLEEFASRGWSNWAVEIRATGDFVGFIGLSVPRRGLPFGPCIEVGWRLKRPAWGHGYATQGARRCLHVGFERLGLEEIVSCTARSNRRSVAVMERTGMANADADFDHPALPAGHPLRPHCLYRIAREDWRRRGAWA